MRSSVMYSILALNRAIYVVVDKMEVGATFASFEELEQAVRQYENTHSVKYTKRYSTTVERERNKQPKHVVK